ncbi:L,D-transpeptidase [Candidatus Poribacteria bacterium]|nr:L,D-transpeptidase [Candidatus Poribacteria bacterium]
MDINNIISPAQIKVGQVIYIPAPTLIFKIKVDIQKNILILFKGDEKIKQFNVASGAKETPTPKGIFTIGNRIANPTWTLDGKNIPGGDPQNGLGSRWMGFKERTQYGIHGTNEPDSIGKSVSHGCIRLLNQDVEELYKIIPIGTKVEIL